MNNIASIETDSISSSDDLPSLSRPKTSTPYANNNGQQTGQSATCMTTDDDSESTMQLVIEVVYHHNDKTYREWYPNNTKADASILCRIKTLNLLWNELRSFNRDINLYIYFFYSDLAKVHLRKTGQPCIVAMRGEIYKPRRQAYGINLGFNSSCFCSHCPEVSNWEIQNSVYSLTLLQ